MAEEDSARNFCRNLGELKRRLLALDDTKINQPIIIIVATDSDSEPGTVRETSIRVMITEAGLNLALSSASVSATSETIPWKSLVHDILSRSPGIFGDLNDPLHQGFRLALRNLGFNLHKRPEE